MNTSEQLMASFAAGVGTTVLAFGIAEAVSGFDPAEHAQQQVDACAAHLPVEPKTFTVKTVPKPCIRYGEYSGTDAEGSTIYQMPGRQKFIDKNSPVEDYDTQKAKDYLAMGSVWGAAASIVSLTLILAGEADKNDQNKPQPTTPNTPKPPITMTIEEYRRRYAKKANKRPLDSVPSEELNRYFANFMNQQRQQSAES